MSAPIARGGRKLRAGVIATCFAAVVFTGVTYGAGLKLQNEWDEHRTEVRALTPEEQISILQTQHKSLLQQREALETKVRNFLQRVKDREAAKAKEEAEKSR
ncbi:hypothetical protein F5X68DRAFT_189679 [Plectosphaerella plurivora]|uniref:Uncharacterized protein n=1 Tax=Plectosphaerella plurivora TaxID=936078 RepID=A0A9P9ABE4_9PEZI|nr:hypothetical protein F5X68DRAFT_189679 [Plectosphaerella plurivora]